MFDDDDHKIGAILIVSAVIVFVVLVAINLGTEHKCKMAAISAGMKSQEVREACR